MPHQERQRQDPPNDCVGCHMPKKPVAGIPHSDDTSHREALAVLVQPEMEKARSPLVSIPPFGRGFSRHLEDHQASRRHGCVPVEPASVSPGKIIVALPHPSVSTSGFPFTRPRGAGLLLPSLNVHAPHEEPQEQRYVSEKAGG